MRTVVVQTEQQQQQEAAKPIPVVAGAGISRTLRIGRHGGACAAGCLGRGDERQADRRDGALGLGQVDADAHPRRPRQADRGRRLGLRHRARGAERHAADEAAARAHRLHLPVLQPAPDAHREGEHRPAALDRGREGRPGLARAADDDRRAAGSALAPALGALRRAAAAGRDRPCAGLEADGDVRGRADRQPRLPHRRGDPRAAARVGRRLRPDDSHGHPRSARGRDRRPDPLPRRRPDRQGRRASRRRTRSWLRWRR